MTAIEGPLRRGMLCCALGAFMIMVILSSVSCSQSRDSSGSSEAEGGDGEARASSSETEGAASTPDAGQERPNDAEESAADAGRASPDAPGAEPIDLLHAVPVEVITSSAFRSKVQQVERIADGDLQTAWNSESGDLDGAWIGLRIPEGATVEAIEMTAGFTKQSDDSDLFTGNHRVRRVRVYRGQEPLGEFPLDINSRELQRIPVSGPGGFYRVELIDVIGGSHQSWREACISELRVLGRAPEANEGSSTPRFRLATPEERTAYTEDASGTDAGLDAGDGSVDAGPAAPSWDPPALNQAGGLRMTRIATCVGVEAGQPIDPRRSFSSDSDERVYCYFRLENPESTATQLTLSWEQPGTPPPPPSSRRTIDVPARNRFGYYSYITTGHRSGRWQCVVRTSEDEVLGSLDFDIN